MSIDGVALGFHDTRFTSPNRLPWRDPNVPGNHLHPMTRVDVETWRFQKKHIGHDGSGVLPKGTRLVKQVFGSFWFHLFLVPSIWFHLFLVPSIFGSIYFWFHLFLVPSIWFHLFLVPSSWFHLFGKCKFHHITWHNFNLADNHKFWWWPDTFFFKPSACSKTCYIT